MKLIDRIFKLILLFITFFSCISLFAQKVGKVDTLSNALKTQDTTSKTIGDTLLRDTSKIKVDSNSVLTPNDTSIITIDTVGAPSQDGNGLHSPVFTTADDELVMLIDLKNNLVFIQVNLPSISYGRILP